MRNDDNEQEDSVELEPPADRICSLLAAGWTHVRIASEVGCSTKTVQRLLQTSDFAEELTRRRRAVVAATTATLEDMGGEALDALRELLGSLDDRVRLRAIEMVLKVGRRYHQEELIEQQVLARLEAVESKARIGTAMGGDR